MPQGDTDSTCSRTADEDVAAASQMEQDQDISGPTTDITRIQDIQQCSASTSHVTSNVPPEGQENEDCTATCRQQIASLECTIKQLQSEKNEVEMNLFEQLTVVHEENQRLQEKLRLTKFCVEVIQNNDTKTCFYTGLPCFDLFKTLFEMLKGYTQTQPDSKGLDQFFAVLVKLRLNVPIQFLADRLDCSKAQFSGFFHMWLDAMYHNLKQLIVWPEAQTLQENLPTSFKKHYSKVRCIIDCFEVFIEKPLSLDTRAATFSNYKKHNTLKVLIAISPTGSIVFISKAWGGRVSDKVITQESGFLDHIEPGDVILADRGFLIGDELAVRRAKLEIPAFTKGKKQLTQEEVEKSRQLARVRIHVERVIGQLRKKYKILQGVLPITLIKRPTDDKPTIDRILVVTAALTNLCPSVVSK